MGIAEKFQTFCSNLSISSETRSTISTRYKAITKRLNRDFWDSDSDTTWSRYIGSFGRATAINKFSDVDMVFVLPSKFYTQYNQYITNGQSALLQAVKNSISVTYPSTQMGADGIVVEVGFSDGITFEVVPVFENTSNTYTHPVAGNGGSWKAFDPISEITAITKLDTDLNGNLKRLCKMARAWIDYCNVPIGGLLIDTLAYNFIKDYAHKSQSYFYYDLFTRDFFKYLADQNTDQAYWQAPGSNQYVYRKGSFEYKAKQAYKSALEAIESEGKGNDYTANQKWREIYGYSFPS
jgi:hypothetical protein